MTTRKLYLYGAQTIAHGMACALRARGCEAAGYVVTERGKTPAVLDGLPVREIGELQESDDEVQFLLAVPPYLHDEIRTILGAHGYHHVTPLDAAMEYREMAAYLRGKGFPSLDLPPSKLNVAEAGQAAGDAEALAAAGIAVFVACSAADPPLVHARPQSPIYHTVQAGAALGPAISTELRDDIGETISQENPHCDELTVTYWAWKNRHDDFSTTTTCSSRVPRSLTTIALGCSPCSRMSAHMPPRFSRPARIRASAATSASSCSPST